MELARQTHLTRINQWLQEFRQIGATPQGGVTRLAYTELESLAKARFIELAKSFGLEAKVDAAGNVRARRRGRQNDMPAIACGSHLDTVVNGGAFDGALGSLAALEVAARLSDADTMTERPIEFLVFSAEESSRFGVATIGSKAMTGLADLQRLATLTDNEGVRFDEAIQTQGLSMAQFGEARRQPGDLAAFIELHIEQGPVLEAQKIPIGVVTGIAAPTRLRIEIDGQAAHSGTTSMDLRHDALLAAAEIALLVEQMAKAPASRCVGTVGVLNVFPNTANTIPGKVTMIVEFRSVDMEAKHHTLEAFRKRAEELEAQRGVHIISTLLSDEAPVPLNDGILRTIRSVCRDRGYDYLDMVSGAGHDAMNMATLCPTGMVFVPSVAGLSHDARELTLADDIDAGADVLYHTVLRLANTTGQETGAP